MWPVLFHIQSSALLEYLPVSSPSKTVVLRLKTPIQDDVNLQHDLGPEWNGPRVCPRCTPHPGPLGKFLFWRLPEVYLQGREQLSSPYTHDSHGWPVEPSDFKRTLGFWLQGGRLTRLI